MIVMACISVGSAVLGLWARRENKRWMEERRRMLDGVPMEVMLYHFRLLLEGREDEVPKPRYYEGTMQ